MWKVSGSGKYPEVSEPVSMRPGWLRQARAVGVRVGRTGDGVGGSEEGVGESEGGAGGTGDAVPVRVGVSVGAGVTEGVGDWGESVTVTAIVAVVVTASDGVIFSWLDEQAASPIPINMQDASCTTAFAIFPISRECTRKLANTGNLHRVFKSSLNF
jgi:hypothetical protein